MLPGQKPSGCHRPEALWPAFVAGYPLEHLSTTIPAIATTTPPRPLIFWIVGGNAEAEGPKVSSA
jgi:hypothetical protein